MNQPPPNVDVAGMAFHLACEWISEIVAAQNNPEFGGTAEDVIAPKLRDWVIAKALMDPGQIHTNLEDAARNHLQGCSLREENLHNLVRKLAAFLQTGLDELALQAATAPGGVLDEVRRVVGG